MGLFEKTFKLEQRYLIIISFLIALIASLFFVFTLCDENWKNIFISISAGLIIALIQFGLSWYEYKTIDKYRKMGIENIYDDKYREEMYGEKIDNAKQKVYLMGNTAGKFLGDFADKDAEKLSKQFLIKKLEKGIEVKILIGKKSLFEGQTKRLLDYARAKAIVIQLSEYKNFKCKYYNHEPAHSIFIFDNECFIGPIFTGISSFDIPFIHMKNEKEFAKKYIKYFDTEWGKAVEVDNTD